MDRQHYNPALPQGFMAQAQQQRHLQPASLPGGPYPQQSFADCDDEDLPTSAPAPHFHAPHQSNSVSFKGCAVINVDAADDALANAAGIALHASRTKFSADDCVLVNTPAGATGAPVRIPGWDYTTPEGWTLVLKEWGVSVLNNEDAAAVVLASINGGPNSGTHAPKPGLSGLTSDTLESTLVILPNSSSLIFSVGNKDVQSPLLVELVWKGWLIPSRYTGTLRSLTREGNMGWGCR